MGLSPNYKEYVLERFVTRLGDEDDVEFLKKVNVRVMQINEINKKMFNLAKFYAATQYTFKIFYKIKVEKKIDYLIFSNIL